MGGIEQGMYLEVDDAALLGLVALEDARGNGGGKVTWPNHIKKNS